MKKETILIVEDDLGLIELISERIQLCGYEFQAVSSAHDAFAWLKVCKPLFMLLDYSLPEMNGKEFLQHLSSEALIIPPFVVATGQGDERVAVEMMKLGARDYIIKDSHFLDLIPVVVDKISKEIENENKLQQTELELKESNQFNKQIIESAHEGIVVFDCNLKYKVFNPYMEKMTGVCAASVLGKHPLEVFPFLLDSGSIKIFEKALRGEIVDEADIEYNIPQNGKHGWSSEKSAPLYNNAGETIGVITTIHDITERKAAEAALEESETKYRELVDNSPDAIIIYSPDAIAFVNNECLRLMRAKSADELLDKNFIEFVHPKYRSFVTEKMENTLNRGDLLPLTEEKFIRLDGTVCDVEVKAIPIRFNDKLSIQLIVRDITEKKQAEKALLKSEALYRDLVFRIPDGVYKSTPEGKFIDVNTAMVKMLGYESKEELMAIDIKSDLYFDSTDRESIVLKEKNEEIETFRLKRKDGSELWVEDHGWYVNDANGNILTHEGVLRDITERRRAAQELDQSQKQFKELFDNAPVGYHELDSEGRIIRVNETELNMLGYSIDELYGKYIWEMSSTQTISMESVQAKLNGKYISETSYEREFIKKDGSLVYVLVQDKILYDCDGNISGLRSTIQDYTEKKIAEKLLLESQQRYSLAIQATRDGLWERNLLTNQSFYSPRWCEILGCSADSPEFQPTYETLIERIHPDDYQQTVATLNYHIENGTEYDLEYRCLHQSGEYRWQSSMGTFVLDETGRPIKIVGCISDISERKKAEEDLRESEKKYRILFAENPQPMFIFDMETLKFIEVNQAAINHYDYSREEFMSMTMADIRPEMEIQDLLENIEKSRQNSSLTLEALHRKKNGESIFVEINSFSIKYDGKSARHVLVKDITQQKQVKDALRNSYSLLNATIESTADGILAVDMKGEISLFNQRFVQMWKVPNELIEINDDELVLNYISSKVINPDLFLQKVRNYYEHCEISGFDQIKLLDGRVFDRYSIPQRVENEIVGRVWSFRDITESKLAEEALRASEDKYRTMIENSNDLIWMLDKEGKFLFYNDVALRTTEINKNEWIGKSYQPLILPEDLDKVNSVFNRTLKGEACSYELRFKKYDENILTLSVNTSPIYNVRKIEGVVCFGRNITEQKQAEQAMNEYMNDLIRFQNLTVGREIAMIGLKKEINEMLVKFGLEEKYVIVDEN